MLRFRHVLSTTVATVIGGGLSLLLAFVSARLLTPIENGYYSQYLLVMNLVFIGFNIGLGPASTYHLAAGLRSFSSLLSLNIRFVGFVGLIVLLIAVALATTQAGKAIEQAFKAPLPIIYIGLVAGVLLMGVNQITALLMGRHRYDRVNVINVLRAALPLLMVAVAGLALGGEQVVATAQTLALVGVLVISFGLLRDLDTEKGDSRNGTITDLLRYGGMAYLANLLHFAAMRGLLLFVSFYSGPEQVGYFNLALLLLEAMLLLPTAIGQLLFPQSSSPTLNKRLIEQLLRLNIYIGLIVALLTISFAEPLTSIVLGDAYSAAGVALIHMAPAIVFMPIPRILSQILSGCGHPGYPMMAAACSSVLGIGFAVLWMPTHGIVGAAWIINLVAAITATVTMFGYCHVHGVRPMKAFTPTWSDFDFIQRFIRKG